LHPLLASCLDQLRIRATPLAVSPSRSFGIGSVGWWLLGVVDLAILLATVLALVAVGPVAGLALLGGWILLTVVLAPLFLLRRASLPHSLPRGGRRLVFVTLFCIWFSFVAKVYVGELLNRHPAEGLSPDAGFMNHVLVQLPCFDFVPAKLRQSESR
jgi:hypothetical protein